MPEQSLWISNDNTPATVEKRGQLRVLNPDIPTRFVGHSVVDSSTNQFVNFDTTSAEKDVMQTTVPFIDAQHVAPTTGTWLSGIGVYHKGAIGYGGFLGISVDTFDFAKHLLPEKVTSPQSMKLVKQDLKFDFNDV